MATWTAFSRGADYKRGRGLPISSLTGVARHLKKSTAVLKTPYSPEVWSLLPKGGGAEFRRDGRVIVSGPIVERTVEYDADNGRALITINVEGDEKVLWDRSVFPNPQRSGDDQTVADYWTGTGQASTQMLRLINEQAGPGASVDRRAPTLRLATDPQAGATRSWQFRYDNLLAALEFMSVTSGADLGVRVTSGADGLTAAIYTPRDLTGKVVFSADLRNLGGFTYTETAPKAVYAIAAGQGDLHLRLQRFTSTSDPLDLAWGMRSETYVDRRDTADPTELLTAATDAITEGAGSVSLAVTLLDTQAATFGRDWDLGDRITVYVGLPGQVKVATVSDVVREVAFDVAETGAESLRPAVGTADAKALKPGPTQTQLAAIGTSLNSLIRRK